MTLYSTEVGSDQATRTVRLTPPLPAATWSVTLVGGGGGRSPEVVKVVVAGGPDPAGVEGVTDTLYEVEASKEVRSSLGAVVMVTLDQVTVATVTL